ncbi:hypothetical protein LEP1GSC036_4368 [Leptospira weilii str. 2006001853]|uniref:Uncharacterized protein n=2 Tax=Leptospira weilii TaxID=28184 RepID=A0A828YXL0_9LEPT|nr:hypothetical protein LEP1GSC036_4368 [Leptospira weilii str. 2006001853]EMJ66102.1 hypothetical protein LEP1GSC051_1068 [Leptospira sp. P2653]EMN46138.1 hypothetical protein LEP1GSC086_3146 [Leptospira weilii str. LNT 1234]EMN91183.1 hypothetical protein LEP1GSC108_1058 [Leptospira weilii str. UI 13098]OMI17787.1 hypothetical protein BUQ74_08320 [Leptospira weilii serovar Heyan]QDK24247.1 hypothetical protein FHG67_17155 [Leptospira weilii]
MDFKRFLFASVQLILSLSRFDPVVKDIDSFDRLRVRKISDICIWLRYEGREIVIELKQFPHLIVMQMKYRFRWNYKKLKQRRGKGC